jgi:5-methylcytosine-specific restriction enzyme A
LSIKFSPKLKRGEKFTRTLSVEYFDTFLQNIQKDYGSEGLQNSLDALKKHIDYIYEQGDSKKKLRKVYQRYYSELQTQAADIGTDEIEQDEITHFYSANKSREDLISELTNNTDFDGEKIVVNHKVYRRSNKAIALIKILRGLECQICGTSILKSDGTKYVEAAHVVPKHQKRK